MHCQLRLLFPFATSFELVGVDCVSPWILETFVYYRKHRNNIRFPRFIENRKTFVVIKIKVLSMRSKCVRKLKLRLGRVVPNSLYAELCVLIAGRRCFQTLLFFSEVYIKLSVLIILLVQRYFNKKPSLRILLSIRG